MLQIVYAVALVFLQAPDTARVFPSIEAQNLAGQEMRLPRDFAGEMNVVFIAFKREQQADVDSWRPTLDSLRARNAALRVYELPTLGRNYRLMRRVIDGGMRGGIPDSATRAATITLYIDKDPFKRALGIDTEERIHVLLVDKQGRVQWHRGGPRTPALVAELTAQLTRR